MYKLYQFSNWNYLSYKIAVAFLIVVNFSSTNVYATDGDEIYNTYCAVCHKLGLNAAPKFGKKAFWAKRVAQGKETVYLNAINGLRGMPPRGGIANLTDEEVKAATDYLVERSGGWGDSQ